MSDELRGCAQFIITFFALPILGYHLVTTYLHQPSIQARRMEETRKENDEKRERMDFILREFRKDYPFSAPFFEGPRSTDPAYVDKICTQNASSQTCYPRAMYGLQTSQTAPFLASQRYYACECVNGVYFLPRGSPY